MAATWDWINAVAIFGDIFQPNAKDSLHLFRRNNINFRQACFEKKDN